MLVTRSDSTQESPVPADILLYIFCYLADKPRQLLLLQTVCVLWKDIATDNSFWRKFCKKQCIERLPANTRIYTLYADRHARHDTFYCMGGLVNPADDIKKCINHSFVKKDEYTTFRTREEAIDYAEELKSCKPAYRTNFNNQLDSFPFIFVVQLRHIPVAESHCSINNTTYRYVQTDPANFVRVYEVLYKTHKDQPIQVFKVPAGEQHALIPPPMFKRLKCTLL